ncbi:NAD(P)-dependent oxidoreductase [Paraburkholderia sp. BR10936]|uniref:NAD(P)-dependent oxidoreductase n=1 Tax=unclassified Paraburkholderia TaxID=2615204 RepID=UPI0034D33275
MNAMTPSLPPGLSHELETVPNVAAVQQVGVVGLGRMGLAFAQNLITDGYQTIVYSRSGKNLATLKTRGTTVAAGWGDLAQCSIVISMVADDDAAESVAESLANVLPTSAIHISMSTISPGASRRIARLHNHLGQGYVAAPVLGSPDLAASRELFVLAAGTQDYLACSLPILNRLGKRTFLLGNVPELANTVKLAANVLTASTMQSMGEVFAFLQKAGIEPEVAFTVFTGSLFDGKVHKAYGGRIAEQRYLPPGMTTRLGLKDLRLALVEAETVLAPMPVASVVRDRMLAAIARGWGDLDWSALGKLAQFSAGIES